MLVSLWERDSGQKQYLRLIWLTTSYLCLFRYYGGDYITSRHYRRYTHLGGESLYCTLRWEKALGSDFILRLQFGLDGHGPTLQSVGADARTTLFMSLHGHLKAVMRYIGYSLGFKQARWGSGFVFLRTTSKVIIYTGEFKVTLFYCISNREAKQLFLS